MAKIDKFTTALVALLPKGDAWPRHPGSVQVSTVRGVAASLVELDDLIDDAPQQWQPGTTVTRLAEWEQAVGLPDVTSRDVTDYEARRADVLARLRGVDLAYEDSSPAALGAIQDELERAGFVVTLTYNLPSRVGDPVGTRLGALDGHLWLIVTSPAATYIPSRVGDPVGTRLGVWDGLDGPRLQAILERVLPARFSYSMIIP